MKTPLHKELADSTALMKTMYDYAAHLIFAAPELLEACKLVERAFSGDGVEMSQAVDACLLAIKRAENE